MTSWISGFHFQEPPRLLSEEEMSCRRRGLAAGVALTPPCERKNSLIILPALPRSSCGRSFRVRNSVFGTAEVNRETETNANRWRALESVHHGAHTSRTHSQLTWMIFGRTKNATNKESGTLGLQAASSGIRHFNQLSPKRHKLINGISYKQQQPGEQKKNLSHVSGKAQARVQRNGNFTRQGLFCREIRRHAEEKLPLAGHSRIQIC